MAKGKNRRKLTKKRAGETVEAVEIVRISYKPTWAWMLERDQIDIEEADACSRYEDDYSIAGYDRGAAALDYSKDRVDGGGHYEMSDRVAVAQSRIGRINRTLTPDQRNVLMACIGDGLSVRDYAAAARKNATRTGRLLKEAIELISGPIGYSTKRPPIRHTIRCWADEMQEAA